MKLLGLFHSYSDPSAAVVIDGRVVAFAEEERFTRNKHAVGAFPRRAVRHVLDAASLRIEEIDAITQAWNCPAYDAGEMASVYEEINARYPTTEGDRAYQRRHLDSLSVSSQTAIIRRNLRRLFGDRPLPPIEFLPHHLSHACMALSHSGFEEDSLVLTIDGSGDWDTTCWWRASGGQLERLHEIRVPHSLGWFYSALTEYLGFQAYDGEYKVMGLAAYGEPDPTLAEKIAALVWSSDNGGFETDPMRISRGPRSYSYYYPDSLAEHFGRSPRSESEEIETWHMSLAFEAQRRLEEIVEGMAAHWTRKTGIRRLVIAGGVGLNIKMNSRLFQSGLLDDLFIDPLCADSGVSIAGAMALEHRKGALASNPLDSVALGPAFSDDQVKATLEACKLEFSREEAVEETVADLLAEGRVVGWFQGAMEGGPRALGQRSILGDPRFVETRDRVNAVIKFREPWRPFCPSMTPAAADRYLERHTRAPFMIIAFRATEAAKREIPAVVHIDGTARVQIVEEEVQPRYFRLLQAFERRTGVACVLNTSFNVRGEPIVCSPHDAIRTFSATGLDALAIGPFLLRKSGI